MTWDASTRRTRLPKDWHRLRFARRELAGGLCEAVEHDPRCDGVGNECHHHEHPEDHRLESLRWLNHWCHNTETQREAKQARSKAKQPDPHPGLISPNA